VIITRVVFNKQQYGTHHAPFARTRNNTALTEVFLQFVQVRWYWAGSCNFVNCGTLLGLSKLWCKWSTA